MGAKKLYETDYSLWLSSTVYSLRGLHEALKNIENLDIINIIEELEGMSKSLEKELRSRLKVLMHHILKYNYQPNNICFSWVGTITEQRQEIKDILEENPSLKKKVRPFCERKYKDAVELASKETRLSIEAFPKSLELSEYEILEKDFPIE